MLKSQKIVRLVMALAMFLAIGGSIPLDNSHVAEAALGSVTGAVTDGSAGRMFQCVCGQLMKTNPSLNSP